MKQQKQYLEAGKIVNTHGVRGEVKIQPWSDTPEFLCGFSVLYIDQQPVRVQRAYVHKNCVIAVLEGVSDLDAAIRLKNKVVYIHRKDAKLPVGQFFVQDLIGLTAVSDDTGAEIGTVSDILDLPAGNVYVIQGDNREILVPAVPEFIRETDLAQGIIRIHLIEGM